MKINIYSQASLIIIGLVLMLTGCEQRTKSESIQAWKAKGKSGKIIKQIYDPIQADRLEAIEALVEMRAKEAIHPLGSLFTDPDKIVVHEAIYAVVAIGGPEIEPYMLQAVALDTIPARIAGAKVLGSFKSPEAVDALIIALDDYKYEELVLAAIKSLGQIADPKAVEPLCAKLTERSYSIREECINSLRLIGNEAAVKGIATRLDDVNDAIRGAVVRALQDSGAVAVPYALEGLRSKDYRARMSSLEVLNGIGAVPEAGNDLVWYRLAELTAQKEAVVDPAKADVFTPIEDRVPALLEALSHVAPAIRDYAFIALENIGSSATEATLEAVEGKAKERGFAWFNQRSEWSGAPSWRLDLWAAATAMNPRFQINPITVELLAAGGVKAEKMMASENFRPVREYIPFLLPQLRGTSAEDEDKIKQVERGQGLATKHLNAAGYQAVFPLLASINGEDDDIAIHAARILKKMNDPRVVKMVVAEYEQQFGLQETAGDADAVDGGDQTNAVQVAVERRHPAEELSGTPMHHAMLEFDIPELQPMLMKIRPTATQTIHAFKQKHPDVRVINLPLVVAVDPALNTVPFRLGYYKYEQMNELRVVYRKNSSRDWIITPPIPDTL